MLFVPPEINLVPLLPALIPALTAMVIMLADAFSPGKDKGWLALLALVGLVGGILSAVTMLGAPEPPTAFNTAIVAGSFALTVSVVVLGAAFVTVLLSLDYLTARGLDHGEFYALLLAATSGMVLMALANDLIIIFLGLELFSLPLYVLAAFWRTNKLSLEAGMKYFILGAFASAFFLYGIALLYGATATTNLYVMNQVLAQTGIASSPLLVMGAGLLLVGFGFKVGLVPFQWWMPDVYEGAPTPVTAFMSVATKAAAFAAFFRAFLVAVPPDAFDWQLVLAVLAVVTMTVGNIAALVQTNIKRMLAYSAIAHAGYILVALVVGTAGGLPAALFYFAAYAAMNLAAFGAVLALGEGDRERLTYDELSGAARQKPWAAAALALSLLSLAGFPPFAGFVAKFFVFTTAVNGGYTWLAVIGVLNSLISVAYYLAPIIKMYMSPPAEGWAVSQSRTPILLAAAVIFVVFLTVAFGLFPSEVIHFAEAGVNR